MFDLALFVPGLDDRFLLLRIMEPIVKRKHIVTWQPYKVASPYTCLDHFPMAFFCSSTKLWHQPDEKQEKAALRYTKQRQKAFAAIYKEEAQAHDPTVAAAHCLVRFAIWKAEHPLPLTPWRLHWRQALLEYAALTVIFVDCELSPDAEACLQKKAIHRL